MGNIKRVRDSKKRAVRQGKEQVWLVDWEKVVNTNHWFAEATGTDVVYDSSWESPQEPLQVYDNGREEVGWGGSWVTLTGLDQYYIWLANTQATSINAYYTPAWGDISLITATSTDSEKVSVLPVGGWDWVAYFQVQCLADEGSVSIIFSDGTNELVATVECSPFYHVESISGPSTSEMHIAPSVQKKAYFTYSPANATFPFQQGDVYVESDNVAGSRDFNLNWLARFYAGFSGDWVNGSFRYYLYSDPETVYTINVYCEEPSVYVQSLSWIPSEISQLAPETWRTCVITYSPEDADHIEAQVQIEIADPNVVWVGIRNVDTSNHTFLVDYFWKTEGSSEVSFYLNGNLVGSTIVTIERPVVSSISNLQYVNSTADWWEVYSRMSAWATFEYTPTRWAWWLTITQTGWTRVDWTSWDTPDWQDISISVEEINYNNGTATVYFFVDSEASVWQRGSWRIAVENDPNEYLDVKITYANEPAPSTDCTITVAVNDNTMGSVDVPSVTVPVGTSISYNWNQVTIWSTTVTATANTWYQQRGWSNMIFTATKNETIMAEFEPETPWE